MDDIVFIDTVLGYQDAAIQIKRTDEFYEIARKLSSYIKDFPLTVEQNNRLIELMIDQVQEAERGAFTHGAIFGLEYGRYEQRLNSE